MRYCDYCGAEIPAGARFCGICGRIPGDATKSVTGIMNPSQANLPPSATPPLFDSSPCPTPEPYQPSQPLEGTPVTPPGIDEAIKQSRSEEEEFDLQTWDGGFRNSANRRRAIRAGKPANGQRTRRAGRAERCGKPSTDARTGSSSPAFRPSAYVDMGATSVPLSTPTAPAAPPSTPGSPGAAPASEETALARSARGGRT